MPGRMPGRPATAPYMGFNGGRARVGVGVSGRGAGSGCLGRTLLDRGLRVVARSRLRLGFWLCLWLWLRLGRGLHRRHGLSARPRPGLRLLLLLWVRRLGLLTLLALPPLVPLVPAIGSNHAIVMLGMLKVIFCADSISGRERVLRQGLVFLDYLEGGSANLSLGPVALEGGATPMKTGAPPVAPVAPRAFAVRTLHTDRLPTLRAVARHASICVPVALVSFCR